MYYPVYLFAGNDSKTIKKTIKKLEDRLFPKNNKLASVTFFASDTTTENIIEECQTYPIFSQNKLIKIFEAELLDQKQIIEYINKPSKFSILILITHKNKNEINRKLIDSISTRGKISYFAEEYRDKSIGFLKTELNKLNIKYKTEDINYILKEESSSHGNLKYIVEKIKEYYSKEKNKTLSIEMLKSISVSSQIPNVFDFIDSLFERNTVNALKDFKQIIMGKGNLIYLIIMIHRQIKIIWMIKTCKERKLNINEIAKETKLSNFVIRKGLRQERNFSLYELETLFNKLADLDIEIRKADEDMTKIIFEMFIIRFAKRRETS